MGRIEEARETLARYGTVITTGQRPMPLGDSASKRNLDEQQPAIRVRPVPRLGLNIALTLAALAWGFVNFGVLLWLPGSLIAEGRSVGLTSALIARSALIAVPTVAVATYLYSLWSTKRVLIVAIGITVLGLLATLLRNNRALPFLSKTRWVSVSFLIVGTSAVISILMPYAAESFPASDREAERRDGWRGAAKSAELSRKDWLYWPWYRLLD